MSKRILAIILLISCLLFLYYRNLKRNNNSIWDLVPSKSIILLEADNPFNKWLTIKEKITNSNFYEIIKSSDDDMNGQEASLASIACWPTWRGEISSVVIGGRAMLKSERGRGAKPSGNPYAWRAISACTS